MHRIRRNGKPVLTPREEAFISAYLDGAGKDAPSAAAKAGYKSPHKIASQLMHQQHIGAEIERRAATSVTAFNRFAIAGPARHGTQKNAQYHSRQTPSITLSPANRVSTNVRWTLYPMLSCTCLTTDHPSDSAMDFFQLPV